MEHNITKYKNNFPEGFDRKRNLRTPKKKGFLAPKETLAQKHLLLRLSKMLRFLSAASRNALVC